MSAREALASCRTSLRLIASVTSEDVVKRLAAEALDALDALARADEERRGKEAERKRLSRAGPRLSADVHGSPVVSAAVRTGGRGGDLSSDSEGEGDPTPEGEVQEGGPQPSADTAGRPRTIRNASDDGAAGMTVDAWCEGISDATRLPCTRPTHGMQRQLVAAQAAHRPATAEPVAWSRESASEYVRANPGREYSVFGYVRYLDSKTPERESGVRRALPPPGGEGVDYSPEAFARARAADAAERDAHEKRLQREAEEGAARYEARRTAAKGGKP